MSCCFRVTWTVTPAEGASPAPPSVRGRSRRPARGASRSRRDPRLVRLERWMHRIDVVQDLPRAGRGASASLPVASASEKAGAEHGEYQHAEDALFHLRSPPPPRSGSNSSRFLHDLPAEHHRVVLVRQVVAVRDVFGRRHAAAIRDIRECRERPEVPGKSAPPRWARAKSCPPSQTHRRAPPG